MAEAYRYGQDNRIFSFASYCFDVFITDIFGGLSAGAVVCIAPQIATMDDLTRLLNVSRSTYVNFTSSAASTLDPHELPHLQSLVLTGEPATRMLFQTWTSRVQLTNSYEAAVITWVDVSPNTDPQCVGNVVPGMEVMVLDDSLRRVPIGVQGTIFAVVRA
ncbi:acetyl-CoA synthetase-like protein [Mollisia scopiformis]|uniref:Acetyl-CoA synthetase-like protein n=1 Tax=Mollisia scopiformis TaxID=149040 RepID=A0A194X1R3_MOLSC|nr:acetyl-CoA synthetase-like protein [Mollisia scopiformis]KUJ14135.1 acetyl-CoA synthetase-like protein [Mollisia scopiformis]